ncbi:MAG: transcription antitermination factor NusB [Bacteroidales bacterium]|nr:transcription antitermination factor NusB [Candidatus Colimorpha onthohippi]
MLSRHFLRAKVLQALYAVKIDETHPAKAVRMFDFQIDRLNELGVRQFSLLPQMHKVALELLEVGMKKFRPSKDELNPSKRFVENPFLLQLVGNMDLMLQTEQRKVDWSDEEDMFKRLYVNFRETTVYKDYESQTNPTYEDHKSLVLQLFKFLINNTSIRSYFADRGLLWDDDFDQIAQYVYMQLRTITEQSNEATPIYLQSDLRLEADQEALKFARNLLSDSIRLYDEYVDLVKAHLKGWDFERVAMMDVLILVMAITEFTEFESIPERVTIDEYIELSKEFSTDRSKLFVNGILDKIVLKLRSEKRIHKSGRGLYVPGLDEADNGFDEDNQ